MARSVPRRAALAVPALLLPGRAALAAWPERPVRVVVPFPPGSATDTLTRILSEPLSRALGQPVVVDNRPGANGTLGVEVAARSPADGYTLLLISTSGAAVNPHTMRRLPYDPIRDFAPIGFIADMPYILAVPPGSPANDLAGFIALARQRPGQLTYSYGNSAAQIAMNQMARMAGIELNGVPYRGGPEALTDVMAGRIDATFTDFAQGLSQWQAQRVKVLAVTTAQPFPLAPQIPPVATVVPGYDLTVWFGMAAPAGTPAPVVDRATEALRAALADPTLIERFAAQGYVPRAMDPARFGAFLRAQIDVWGERVRAAGIEPQ